MICHPQFQQFKVIVVAAGNIFTGVDKLLTDWTILIKAQVDPATNTKQNTWWKGGFIHVPKGNTILWLFQFIIDPSKDIFEVSLQSMPPSWSSKPSQYTSAWLPRQMMKQPPVAQQSNWSFIHNNHWSPSPPLKSWYGLILPQHKSGLPGLRSPLQWPPCTPPESTLTAATEFSFRIGRKRWISTWNSVAASFWPKKTFSPRYPSLGIVIVLIQPLLGGRLNKQTNKFFLLWIAYLLLTQPSRMARGWALHTPLGKAPPVI